MAANATRLRKAFQSRRYVHPVPEDVATVEHDISDIDADAQLDPLLLWDLGIALGHAPLDIDSTPRRVYDAGELSEQPVSGVLDNPPAVFSDLWLDERAQVVLKLRVRAPPRQRT
jgi:hypothetical protein